MVGFRRNLRFVLADDELQEDAIGVANDGTADVLGVLRKNNAQPTPIQSRSSPQPKSIAHRAALSKASSICSARQGRAAVFRVVFVCESFSPARRPVTRERVEPG